MGQEVKLMGQGLSIRTSGCLAAIEPPWESCPSFSDMKSFMMWGNPCIMKYVKDEKGVGNKISTSIGHPHQTDNLPMNEYEKSCPPDRLYLTISIWIIWEIFFSRFLDSLPYIVDRSLDRFIPRSGSITVAHCDICSPTFAHTQGVLKYRPRKRQRYQLIRGWEIF